MIDSIVVGGSYTCSNCGQYHRTSTVCNCDKEEKNSMFNYRSLYISTTLPYVNSEAHIGHTFEFVLADFFKRYYDSLSNDKFMIQPTGFYDGDIFVKTKHKCFLNTGIDEHGQKIFQKSQELGMDTQEYCDKMSETWKEFCKKLNIQYDFFYRTSHKNHKKLSQEYLFMIRDFIYQKDYSGKYCSGCESFKTEKEIIDDCCNIHTNIKLQEVKEKNFFFPLTKFKNLPIEEILVDKTLLNELKFIVENCGDLSISRENVSWGIQIPFSNQTMYVWFEALLNYVFTIGYNPSLLNFIDFSNLWKNSLIICGKDNLKFQAFILPAILKSAGINPPKKVLVHGMILDKNGVKMSKSLGNVINPIEQLEKYNLNALRYYLLAGINTFQDSNYSEEELVLKYNNDLCNNLGNLISRVSSLIEKYQLSNSIEFKLTLESATENMPLFNKAKKVTSQAHLEIKNNFNTKNCFSILNELLSDANKYYTEQKPFDEKSKNRTEIIQEMIYLFILIVPFYESVTPGFSSIIQRMPFEKVIPYPKIEIEKNGRK